MSSDSATSLGSEREAEFLLLQNEGKKLAKEGKLNEALEKMKKALLMCHTEKLVKRVAKLEKFLEECEEEEVDPMIEVGKGFYIYHELYKKLYPYQKEGILWLWKLFRKQKGGVLGDDMGLGKTVQIIAFLSGLFDAELIKSVLIIMPVSLLPVWEKEFDKWAPGICIYSFYSSNKREGEKNLKRVQQRGGVIITSYGMLVNSCDRMAELEGHKFIWDYLILDEGHKIKNPTKTTKAVHGIPSKNRIVLTGTPIQNNLKELWALYDFAHQGALLGSLNTFRIHYETPITRSREKDATLGERRLGSEIAENLRRLIAPYFLRRTKAEVLQMNDKENFDPNRSQLSKDEKLFSLERKNDFITWIFLSPAQLQIYRDFLQLDMVKNILMSKRSPLVELTVLKKICDHPRLLSRRACIQLGLDGAVSEEELETTLQDESTSTMSIDNISDDTLIEESGKLAFLLKLLENLRSENHRTLIFSQSRKILDIIQRILRNRNWKVMRIDGTLTKVEDRERNIQHFQKDPSYYVFLLTTQVGGVGLTLTEADRVIIYDPSWNPATDAQAVDRVYRIGQSKSVIIYRLITCGTVEEKIYRRQIFKDSITRQATGGDKDPHRYFTRQELRELFTMDNPYHSSTQVQLEQMHCDQRKTDLSLDEHVAFLYSLGIFGISDHDLMFSKDFPDKPDDDTYGASDYIKQKVEMAQQVVQVEANQMLEDNLKAGTYARPFTVPITSLKRTRVPDPYKAPFADDMHQNVCSTEPYNFETTVDKNEVQDISNLPSALNEMGEHGIHKEIIDVEESEKEQDCSDVIDDISKTKLDDSKNMQQNCEGQDEKELITEGSYLKEKDEIQDESYSLKESNHHDGYMNDPVHTHMDIDDKVNFLNRSMASIVIVSDSDNSLDEDMDLKMINKPIGNSRKSFFVPDSDSSKDKVSLNASTSFDMFVADSDEDNADELMAKGDASFSRSRFQSIADAKDANFKYLNKDIEDIYNLNRTHSNVDQLRNTPIQDTSEGICPKNKLPENSSCIVESDVRNSHEKTSSAKCRIKRIIPLHLPFDDKVSNIPSSPFQKALSASVEVSPILNPCINDASMTRCAAQNALLEKSCNPIIIDDDMDSPVQKFSKRNIKRQIITSDTEDGNEEVQSDCEDSNSRYSMHDSGEPGISFEESCEEDGIYDNEHGESCEGLKNHEKDEMFSEEYSD